MPTTSVEQKYMAKNENMLFRKRNFQPAYIVHVHVHFFKQAYILWEVHVRPSAYFQT